MRRESGSASALYAAYHKAGGDTRSLDMLHDEGVKRLAPLRNEGLIWVNCDKNYGDPPEANTRITRIYSNARRAIYATLDEAVISDSSPRYFRVRTRSSDRDDYLAHPAMGELINGEDAVRIQSLYPARRPQVQVGVSVGSMSTRICVRCCRAYLASFSQPGIMLAR